MTPEWVRAHYQRLGIPIPAEFAETPNAASQEPADVPEDGRTKVRIPRGMNKWERAYAQEELEPRRLTGEILWYGFEAMKIRLADGAHYTPDFAVLENTGALLFIEVKGMWREAARVRIKVAADLTPFQFHAVTKDRQCGGWKREIFWASAKRISEVRA